MLNKGQMIRELVKQHLMADALWELETRCQYDANFILMRAKKHFFKLTGLQHRVELTKQPCNATKISEGYKYFHEGYYCMGWILWQVFLVALKTPLQVWVFEWVFRKVAFVHAIKPMHSLKSTWNSQCAKLKRICFNDCSWWGNNIEWVWSLRQQQQQQQLLSLCIFLTGGHKCTQLVFHVYASCNNMKSRLDFLDSVHLGGSGSAVKGITSSKEQRCGEVSRGKGSWRRNRKGLRGRMKLGYRLTNGWNGVFDISDCKETRQMEIPFFHVIPWHLITGSLNCSWSVAASTLFSRRFNAPLS